MPTVLDELIVQGINQSLSHSIASALSGGLSGAIGNLAGAGMLNNLTFSDPQLQATVNNLKSQLPATQGGGGTTPASSTPASTPAPATEVSPVTVTATPPPSALGALGQVIAGGAGTNTLAGGAGTDTIPTQSPTDQGKDQNKDAAPTSEVSPVTVTADRAGGGIPPAALLLPAGAAGAAALLSGGGGGAAANPAAAPATEVSPVTVTGQPPASLTPGQAGAVGAGAGAVAGSGLPGDNGAGQVDQATGDNSDYGDLAAGATAGAGLTLPFGLTAKDLLAAGLLAGGVALNGGSGGGGGGNPSDQLANIAQGNADLANRLGGIATAGMAGNIGGMGLNSIGRMVRKAQAAIRQRYASMGMSGSTAEQQDLQAAADSGVDLQFKVGQEMATTGLNAIAALTGQSAQIYAQLLNAQTAKDTALGNALANFAGSLVK